MEVDSKVSCFLTNRTRLGVQGHEKSRETGRGIGINSAVGSASDGGGEAVRLLRISFAKSTKSTLQSWQRAVLSCGTKNLGTYGISYHVPVCNRRDLIGE